MPVPKWARNIRPNPDPIEPARELTLYLVAIDREAMDNGSSPGMIHAAELIMADLGHGIDKIYFNDEHGNGTSTSFTIVAYRMGELLDVNHASPLRQLALQSYPFRHLNEFMELASTFFVSQCAVAGYTSIVVVTSMKKIEAVLGLDREILPGSVHPFTVTTTGPATSLGLVIRPRPALA